MARLDVTNPATGAVIETLPADTLASVAERYARARAAQPAWAARSLAERVEIVRGLVARLQAEADTLAAIQSEETGKPVGQARGEILATPGRVAFLCDRAAATLESEAVYGDEGMTERIEHDPLGVIANISAWNYPWFVSTNVLVPGLIAGNAVLFKPSEFAPRTGLALVRLLHASGVPEDVVQCVTGDGAVGAALLEQNIDGVFFTGSYATGKRIAEAVAGKLIKVQLELGGKDPVYVTDDVDVAAAAAGLADGAFYNTGQSCCAVERIYVHRAVYDEFLDAFARTVSGFVMGDPADADTYIGALTRAAQLDVLEAQIADALAKGGRALVGDGTRGAGAGNWFAPTVVADANHEMALMRDESFGPVIGIMPVADDAEAQALMADTEYGLTAAVYSRDEARARNVLRGVPSGSAYWNCCDRVSPRLPWSGRGHSGLGLTLSTHGILTFTQPRAWHMRAPA